jgi:hypothetical protein
VLFNEDFADPFLTQHLLLSQRGSYRCRRYLPLVLENFPEGVIRLAMAQAVFGDEDQLEIAVGIDGRAKEASGEMRVGFQAQMKTFAGEGRDLLIGLLFIGKVLRQVRPAGELDGGDILEVADLSKAFLVLMQLDMVALGVNRAIQQAGFFRPVQKFDDNLGLHGSPSASAWCLEFYT